MAPSAASDGRCKHSAIGDSQTSILKTDGTIWIGHVVLPRHLYGEAILCNRAILSPLASTRQACIVFGEPRGTFVPRAPHLHYLAGPDRQELTTTALSSSVELVGTVPDRSVARGRCLRSPNGAGLLLDEKILGPQASWPADEAEPEDARHRATGRQVAYAS
jgi:hypothetical protein